MKVSISSAPAQSRQARERFANPQESLSYELGKAVQELPPFYTRLLAGTITFIVFSTITWAHFSEVEEVASANGELIPSAQVRPIRALGNGSIQDVKKREGETVRKGEVLVQLDSTLSQVDVDRLQKSAQLIREDIARLDAERMGQSIAGSNLQNQLLSARLREFENNQAAAIAEANRQIATVDENRVRLSRLQENLINARTNLKNAQERERSLGSLLESNAVPRLDYIEAQDRVTDAEDKVITLEKEFSAQQDKIRQSQQAFQSAQSQAARVGSQRRSEILTELNKRREELANIEGQLEEAKKQRDKDKVEAPFDGTIYAVKATRGPVQAGEELMSVAPKGENLLLEVKVLNRDIGFIRQGMRAKVKMATFPYQEFGIVEGIVENVSPNAIADKDLGPIFMTRVRLQKRTIKVRNQDVDLTPGMAATAEIVTRKKSILTFITEPVTRRFSEAFSVR